MKTVFPSLKQSRWSDTRLAIPAHPILRLELPPDAELVRRKTLLQRELRRTFSGAKFTASPAADYRIRLTLDATHPAEGYRIDLAPEQITCAARDWRGLLYAVVTLAQLVEDGTLPCGTAEDWPDTPLRACSRWMIDLEGGRRAYDWGDGQEEPRLRRKIDFAMRYKINAVFFEGFTWEREKTPDYAQTMRRLNRYAALRNVALEYGGHGIGVGGRNPEFADVVGCGFVRGLGGLNRLSYPDGELYRCMGMSADHATRYNGSCRSNEALNRLKALDIIDYVKKLEPRMLYIHHEDISVLEELHGDWLQRCPECRRRWPDDRVSSPTGAAGAMAYGMRLIYEAVCSVRNQRSHYDAKRDCRVVFVPPGYGACDVDDNAWSDVVRMFDAISAQLPPSDNLYLATREQFFKRGSAELRIPEVAAAVHRHGHRFFLFAINGADTYVNGRLFAPSALLNGFYRTSDCIFNFAGTVFQEPQEVFNAECCWNLPPVCRQNDAEFRRQVLTIGKPHAELIRNCVYAATIPPELTAERGFLREFCTAFYGPGAGGLMLRLLQLGDAEVWPLATLCRNFTKEPFFDLASARDPAWLARWRKIAAVTAEGAMLAREASRYRMRPLPGEMVRALATALTFGGLIAECVVAILQSTPEAATLWSEADAYCRTHYPNAADAEGDMGRYPEYLKRLQHLLPS